MPGCKIRPHPSVRQQYLQIPFLIARNTFDLELSEKHANSSLTFPEQGTSAWLPMWLIKTFCLLAQASRPTFGEGIAHQLENCDFHLPLPVPTTCQRYGLGWLERTSRQHAWHNPAATEKWLGSWRLCTSYNPRGSFWSPYMLMTPMQEAVLKCGQSLTSNLPNLDFTNFWEVPSDQTRRKATLPSIYSIRFAPSPVVLPCISQEDFEVTGGISEESMFNQRCPEMSSMCQTHLMRIKTCSKLRTVWILLPSTLKSKGLNISSAADGQSASITCPQQPQI